MGSDIDGVSVIIPTYNSSKTITESMDSVVSQEYKKWEIIVIDDCSKDDTCKKIEEYLKKYSNIKLLRMPQNVGVSAARNRGVKAAKYDWISFLDSDDLWEKTKLEKQVALFHKHPNGVLFYTGSSFIDEVGNAKNYVLSVPTSINYKKLLPHNIISCSSVLVQKKQLFKYKMPECNEIHEDFLTWLRILRSGKKAYGATEPLLIYRLSSNSKSSNKLHAARMNWRVYKELNLSVFKRILLMCDYAFRSLYKYFRIEK